jgi:hypothetical protein
LIRGDDESEAGSDEETHEESCEKKVPPYWEKMLPEPVLELVERFRRWFVHALSFLCWRFRFLDDQYTQEGSVLPDVGVSSEMRLDL